MSNAATVGDRPQWEGRPHTGAWAASTPVDFRRALQLGLAGLWLLDAALQYQGVMFSKAFGQMLRGASQGNPGVIAGAINWNAALVMQHAVALNAIFATIQLLIGIGVALRPTLRLALAASIAWALGVWLFGEGLGMVLTSSASPVSGAPGPVILYALLAVLLWPRDRSGAAAPFTAARWTGAPAARALWLVLWLSLAYFALLPANRSPQALRDMLVGIQAGEPGWLASIGKGAAALTAQQGLAASTVLAVVFVVIAIGVYLPRSALAATLVLAIMVALVIWVAGQAVGAILAGGATDPGSGPLLILLAASYWPIPATDTRAQPAERGKAAG